MAEDLRRRVLDASAAIVAAEGVASLSVREVARRAGVSHQAPYHHFGDREGILAALVQEGFAALADAVESTAAVASPTERLAAAGAAYVRFASTDPGHFRVMFRPDLVPLARWPAANAEADRAHAALAAAVAACEAAGLVRPGEAAELVAGAWALVHGLAVLVLDGPLAPPSAGGGLHAASAATAEGTPAGGAAAGGGTRAAEAAAPHAERVAGLLARLLADRGPSGRAV